MSIKHFIIAKNLNYITRQKAVLAQIRPTSGPHGFYTARCGPDLGQHYVAVWVLIPLSFQGELWYLEKAIRQNSHSSQWLFGYQPAKSLHFNRVLLTFLYETLIYWKKKQSQIWWNLILTVPSCKTDTNNHKSAQYDSYAILWVKS